MADELADMYITMRANMDPFNRSLREGEATGEHFRSSADGIFSSVAKAALALGSVIGGASIFKSMYDEAVEAQKVTAQTNAVLASTGNAAHVTAAQVGELATAISNKIAVDDEAVQSAANLLLTFTNVRNEAGKGNDIFTQATRTVFDMSVALGEDASSSAIQLGKALNDPIRGITALQRVGVTFTQQQRDQIKALVDSGRTLEAQKIILAELNREFGGSAEAAATPMERLGVVIKNLEEQVGTAFLPLLEAVSNVLADVLPGALAAASKAFSWLSDHVLKPIVDVFSDIAAGFSGKKVHGEKNTWVDLGRDLHKVWDDVKDAFGRVRDKLSDVVDFVKDHWTPVWQAVLDNGKKVVEFVRDNQVPVLAGLGAAALGAAAAFHVLAGAATEAAAAETAALAPFILVGVAVGALVGGVVYAYQHFETFRNVVDAVGSWLTNTFVPAVVKVFNAVRDQVEHLAAWWREHWDSIHDAVRNVLIAIGAVIYATVRTIMFVWDHFGDQIMAVVQFVWDTVVNVVQTAVRIIGDLWAFFADLLSGNWGKAWDDVKDILAAAWEFIRRAVSNGIDLVIGFFTSLPGNILGAVKDLGSKLYDFAVGVMNSLWDGIKDTFANIINWFMELPGRIIDAIGDLSSLLLSAGADLASGFLEGIKNAFGSIGSVAVGDVGVGGVANAVARQLAPPPPVIRKSGSYAVGTTFATAGLATINERGPEMVVLRGGEQVMTAHATRSLFADLLHSAAPPTVEHVHTLDVRLEMKVDGTTDGRKLAKEIAPAIRDELNDMPVPRLWVKQ